MGQVIAFPRQPRRRPRLSAQRVDAALKVVCQVGYMLGFFLVIPGTALMAMKYVAVTQPVGIAACLGLMVVAVRLTLAAYRRI
jgi:hypothetical protein